MNEIKIKELEAQIKALKEEKPRTDREVLESIETLSEKILRKVDKTDYLMRALPLGTKKLSDGNYLLPDNSFKEAISNSFSIQPVFDSPRYEAYSLEKYYNPEEYYRKKLDSLISMNKI